jgi:hypothetical protein
MQVKEKWPTGITRSGCEQQIRKDVTHKEERSG